MPFKRSANPLCSLISDSVANRLIRMTGGTVLVLKQKSTRSAPSSPCSGHLPQSFAEPFGGLKHSVEQRLPQQLGFAVLDHFTVYSATIKLGSQAPGQLGHFVQGSCFGGGGNSAFMVDRVPEQRERLVQVLAQSLEACTHPPPPRRHRPSRPRGDRANTPAANTEMPACAAPTPRSGQPTSPRAPCWTGVRRH
jgi:hypothetical protein